MNKDKAMQMLKAKLYLLKQQENARKQLTFAAMSQRSAGAIRSGLTLCSRIQW